MLKEKVLLQVWGKKNSGKTSTIKIIYNEIKKKYVDSTHTYSFPLPKGEISDILTITPFKCNDNEGNNLTIGFSSMGDDLGPGLKMHLNNCFASCDIIIAASRVYNNVDTFLGEESERLHFRRIKATNFREVGASRSVLDDLNKLSADDIIALIEKLIDGVI